MDLAPCSEDDRQRQEHQEDACERAAVPKPTARKMKLRNLVKDKGTQTFGLMYTSDVGVQASFSDSVCDAAIIGRAISIINDAAHWRFHQRSPRV